MSPSSLFVGMATQAFAVSFLTATHLITPSALHQFVCGCFLLATALFFSKGMKS